MAPPARARAAPARPDRPRAGRARRLLRLPGLRRRRRRRGRRLDARLAAVAARRRPLRRPAGADRRGRDRRAAAGAARRAPVPRGRDLPVRRALPRPGRRHARHRPRGRAPRLLGSRVGAHARRHDRRGALLGRLDAARRRRRPHRRRLPLPRGRPAAHGRVRGRRREGDGGLDHARGAVRQRGGRAPPGHRRGAARARDRRGPRHAAPRQGRRDARVRRPAGVRARRRAAGGARPVVLVRRGPLPRSLRRRAAPGARRAGARARAAARAAGARRGARAGRGRRPGGRDQVPRPGRPDAAGPLPRVGHRLARLRLDRPRSPLPQALQRRGQPPRHRRAGEDRRPARRGARALPRAGEGDRHGRRPAHHPLRAAPGARHQGRQGRPAQGRPRVRARGVRHPHPRPDPRQAGRRRRGPQHAPAHRPPRRRLPGAAGRLVAADGLARQGRRGPRDRRRPGQDAAPARRGHHRRGQVGRGQRDAVLDPAARHPARGADGARGPQAGRAQPLRLDPAPADAGDHLAAPGRDRAAEPRARDGAALHVHVAGPHALAGGAQQGPRAPRRAAAALHPVRHRRARRPDDGRARRRRGLDHPDRPEGARGRHPPRARDAVARAWTSSRA